MTFDLLTALLDTQALRLAPPGEVFWYKGIAAGALMRVDEALFSRLVAMGGLTRRKGPGSWSTTEIRRRLAGQLGHSMLLKKASFGDCSVSRFPQK